MNMEMPEHVRTLEKRVEQLEAESCRLEECVDYLERERREIDPDSVGAAIINLRRRGVNI